MTIKRTDTGEFYVSGYGTLGGPRWTKSKWSCYDGGGTAGTVTTLYLYELLMKSGFPVVIED